MKKIIRYIIKNWLLITAGLILTRKAIEYCYEQRGGFFIGGEWFILPVILMVSDFIPKFAKSVIDTFREEEDDAGEIMEDN